MPRTKYDYFVTWDHEAGDTRSIYRVRRDQRRSRKLSERFETLSQAKIYIRIMLTREIRDKTQELSQISKIRVDNIEDRSK
jgi:hypothetical protein